MKILTYILTLCMTLLLGVSCTTKFGEYNDNPNEMDLWKIGPSGMIQEVIFAGTEIFLYRTWTLNGELIQYTFAGSGNNTYHRYVIDNAVGSSAWSNLYKQAASVDHMRELAIHKEDENYEAIAITLKALFLSNATDIFGDCPYSQAFKGPSEGLRQPVFDSQESIYRALLEDLEHANTLYNTSKSLTSSDRDLLYKGDLVKWRKFNNSLYLRLLMRLSNRNTAIGVAAKIGEIFSNPEKYPVFAGNADNATLFYDAVEPMVNYFGTRLNTQFTTSTGRRPAEQIIDMMNKPGDPRISIWFKQPSGAEGWKGGQSGIEAQEADLTGIANLNKENLGEYDSPYALMKYDEVLFIFAEAMQRGWIAGDTEAYYQNAVRASIEFWKSMDKTGLNITDKVIENFLANVPYDGTLESIINQKYVALFWVGFEAWADYRRTGYPALTIGNGTFNDHILPMRLVYPTNVGETNTNNHKNAVARLKSYYGGDDDMKTPVWWSKAAVDRGIK
ncbi:SusD/RagB family nutrient-binding outer membrane lipoprotein [uncultured Alistipes sp.]|jgi:hypothetical protein|uniref:SusD/RagB family nutrient-binding outer membrane lipoprotein n=1 Tax=uncultured Alistipes sp. TaxID=538949 RepID=UPI0025E05185|nr:SusD/RagB family nutrient-binding outer membrane lipoprotein [uncultured Alistipes sp.]